MEKVINNDKDKQTKFIKCNKYKFQEVRKKQKNTDLIKIWKIKILMDTIIDILFLLSYFKANNFELIQKERI